ncbi:hypothetical protein VTN77DRAFT_4396 [Rasamsonia byssochlamydoides]|uniref:uncharacterized protein n=1 Tax=Rasamsonia byssochlamydoides TaxID=89139 RepID=UPI0037435575
MRLSALLSVVLTLGVSFTRADEVSDEERCVEAIFEAYTHLSFTGSHSQPFLVDSCLNPLRTWSIYASVKVFCVPDEIQPGLRHINEPCQGEMSRTPYADIAPALTEDYIRSLRVVDYAEVPKDVELDTPVLISRAYYEAAFRTNAAWSLTSRMHRTYGAASYFFWGSVLLVGTINHFLTNLFHLHRRCEKECLRGPSKYLPYLPGDLVKLLERIHHWIRTNLIIPAAIGSYHQRLFYYCSIPTRMEAIPIISFYLLSFAFMALSYDIFEGNLYWPDTSEQFWRYLSDRTGILAYANLCLLWLFGGRNNPFLWATGWKFSTFNLFHRTIARVATIQAIVHSVGYTILVMRKNTYALYLPNPWWYMGIAATVCMSLLLLFSSIYLRRYFYELFLLIHITFSVVVIVGLFTHTAIFSGRYDIYLWPVVLVWSLDRLARIVRLVYCNIHIYINRKRLSFTRGRVSYNRLSDILWLEITVPFVRLEPKPGQHYYIYQPTRWRGYENHPFTLGSWTVADSESDLNDALPLPSASARPTTSRKLIFWIRPYDGWTRRLRNDCLRESTLTVESTFLIEGPYGQVSPLYNYENVILIAGGSGIAGVLPYIQDHLRRSRHSCGEDVSDDPGPAAPGVYQSRNNTRTRNVTLIWTARQHEFIEEIASYGLRSALQREDVHIKLYATSEDNKGLSLQETVTKIGPPSSPTEHTSLIRDYGSDDSCLDVDVDVALGRPDIKGLISELVRDSGLPGSNNGDNGERTAVLVCGPGGMADDARFAVHQMLKEGYRVDYFEEAFGW